MKRKTKEILKVVVGWLVLWGFFVGGIVNLVLFLLGTIIKGVPSFLVAMYLIEIVAIWFIGRQYQETFEEWGFK